MGLRGLDWQTVPIPLASGVDQKADLRALPPPRLARLENGVFDKTGGVQKRGGYSKVPLDKVDLDGVTDAGVVNSARMRALGALGNEELLFAEGRVFSFVEKMQNFQDRGRCESVLVRHHEWGRDRHDQRGHDRAELSGVILTAWYDLSGGASAPGVRYQVHDKLTNALMSEASFAGSAPVCRAVGTKLHLYWWNSAAARIELHVIDPAAPTNGLGVIIIVGGLSTVNVSGRYDVHGTGGNALIAWNTAGNQVQIVEVDGAGATVQTRLVARSCGGPVAITKNGTHVALARVTILLGTGVVKLDWLKADLSDEADVDHTLNGAGTGEPRNITVGVRGTHAFVCWDPRLITVPLVRVAHGIMGGAYVTDRVLVRRSFLASRISVWDDNGTERLLVNVMPHEFTAEDAIQNCYVLIDVDSQVGDANGTQAAGDESGVIARILPGRGAGAGAFSTTEHLAQLEIVGANEVAYAATAMNRLPDPNWGFRERGLVDTIYTFNDSRAYKLSEEGRAAYGPGGIIWQYDGKRVTENGFLMFPNSQFSATSIPTGTGFLVPTEVYNYIAIYETQHDGGEVERSTFHKSVAVPIDPGDDTVRLVIPCLQYTMRPNFSVYIVVYRTLKNSAGPYYRLTSLNPVDANCLKSDVNAETVTFDDKQTDAVLALSSREQFYGQVTTAGTPLARVSAPPSSVVTTGQGRVFSLDPIDTNRIVGSVIRLAGYAIEGSGDAVEIRVPHDGGAVVGLAVDESGLIAFKEDVTYLIAGQGPDNLGVGPYPMPTRIAELGCIEPRSIVRSPVGTFFRSRKGLHLLDPSGSAHYIGAAVERDANATIYGAVHVPDKHEVRFLLSDKQLVFNYRLGEWSIWPNSAGSTLTVGGKSMALWRGEPVHLGDGIAPIRPNTTFLDGATGYPLVVETAWQTPAGLGGFVSVRRLLLSGEWRGPHNMRIRTAYDFAETDAGVTWTDDDTYTPENNGTAITAPGQTEQFEHDLSRHQVQAFKHRFEDVYDGRDPLAEGARLTGYMLSVGQERGSARLPSGQRK